MDVLIKVTQTSLNFKLFSRTPSILEKLSLYTQSIPKNKTFNCCKQTNLTFCTLKMHSQLHEGNNLVCLSSNGSYIANISCSPNVL